MFSLLFLSACADLSILEDDIDIAVQAWCAPNQDVEVTRVYDGDTFIFWEDAVEQKIRMLGVAAPEVQSSESSAECYGDEAGEFLRELILNEKVRLEFDVETNNQDNPCADIFQRTLAWVILEGDDPEIAEWMSLYEMQGLNSDGSYELLVNEILVRMGYATVFQGEVDQSVRYKVRMEEAEEAAEEELLGLWWMCE